MDMMKQLAVRIAEQIHHEAKIQATRMGITLREYVEDALTMYNAVDDLLDPSAHKED